MKIRFLMSTIIPPFNFYFVLLCIQKQIYLRTNVAKVRFFHIISVRDNKTEFSFFPRKIDPTLSISNNIM